MSLFYCLLMGHHLGFRSTTVADRELLTYWLTTNILDSAPTIEQCLAHADMWLHSNGIEPISLPTLERVVRSALHRYEQDLQVRITNALTTNTKESFETLINGDHDDETEKDQASERIRIHHLKNDLRGTKMAYLEQANILLDYLQQLSLPIEALEKIPRSWVQKSPRAGIRYEIGRRNASSVKLPICKSSSLPPTNEA